MHYVVCIKQVPDTAEVKIDPETNTLVRAGVESISNPYDTVALEEAVRLKERYGGTVTAICMGPPQAEVSLREALAAGADRVVLLSDRKFAGADTLATSYTLSSAIETLSRDLSVDIVFCGKQAVDGDTAQTGPGIATRLGYTLFTYVVNVDWIQPDERQIQVRRHVEDGTEVIRGRLPVVLTTELELAEPRRAPLTSMIRSFREPVQVWDGQAIGADPTHIGIKGSPTWVRAISSPPAKEGGPLLDATADIPGSVAQALDLVLSEPAYAEKFKRGWEA
jgi:electron transfer flavoprotein beta subunit